MEAWKKNLFFAWIGQFFSIMGFNFAIPFAPFYLRELGVTDSAQLRFWTGLFGAATGLTMTFASPIWGYLADRWGKKLMTLRASLGGAVVLLAMGLVQSPEMLIACRLLQGIFTGTITAYLTLVVATTPKERMGLVIGLMNSAVFCGTTVAPLLGGVFSDWFGYRASFFIAAGLLLMSFVISLVFVQEPTLPKVQITFSFLADLQQIFLMAGVTSVVGMLFCYSIAQTIQRPQLPLLVQEVVSGSIPVATQTGLVLSAGGVASVLAGIIIGNLADRGNLLKIGVFCSLAGSVFVEAIFFARSVWQIALLTFLFSCCAGGLEPILQTMLTRLVPPEKRGSAFGVNASARSLGWFIGGLSGGIVASILNLHMVFLVSAGLFILVAGLLVLLRKQFT